MSKVKILPEILSNKIAAGEVVERPASVVKELVENALDAGSTRITVEVEKGGRSLIRVADNGSGMSRDDALLAIERYATSKIYNDKDLFAIKSLGFRGEALPSIASVSKFSLISRDAISDAGVEILIEGGRIRNVGDVGAPVGTMITVKQLFYNTPARRKFLKTINTEMGHIGDMLASMALGWPQVRFRFLHNGRVVKDWPEVSNQVDRVVALFGRDNQNNLLPIDLETEAVCLSGWICSPRAVRSTSRGIYVFVNGRFVKDRIVLHALFQGFGTMLMKGRFPLAVLSLQVPPDQVDVNVHPTKHEVRFAHQKQVHDAVASAVASALQNFDRSKWGAGDHIPGETGAASFPVPEAGHRYRPPENRSIGFSADKVADAPLVPMGQPASGAGYQKPDIPPSVPDVPPSPVDPQPSLWQTSFFQDLRVIGQLRNTYILCDSKEGLILIDQHAAHERVLFEQLKQRQKVSTPAVQRLLMPETVELGYREAGLLEKMIPALHSTGLDIEPFGGNTFVVKGVPALLAGREAGPLIVELVETAADTGIIGDAEKMLDHCLEIMACHGAIRAHQTLSQEQIQALLKQLDNCKNPSNCPHGRPTWIKWTLRFIEKSFGRIV
jgi:DNA mismatch repair protein MutL